jgi:hypothetical protein
MADGMAPRTKALLAIAGLSLARTVTGCAIQESTLPFHSVTDAASPDSTF